MTCHALIPKYDSGMKRAGKVAVSLPEPTLRRLESARKRLGKTRSAAVAEAIEYWLGAREVDAEDRRYVEAYLKHPERTDETAAVASAVIAGWDPWE